MLLHPPEDRLDWGSCESCRLSAKTRQRREHDDDLEGRERDVDT
jgi:hypothetical protein